MAKKLTARQKQARKKAAYVKAEYYKNVDAIRYLERFGVTKDIKIPNKITKRSLQSIRRIYKEVRANVEKIKEYDGYVAIRGLTAGEIVQKLPTKAQQAKEYRYEEKGIKEGRFKPFNPDEQYLEELKNRIEMLQPTMQTERLLQKSYQKQINNFHETRVDFLNSIDRAIKQYGEDIVAHALENNQYMQRIDQLGAYYVYQVTEELSDAEEGIIDLIDATTQEALGSL